MSKKERKKHGQFFTSKETARFMAELYNIPNNKSKVSVLDAGNEWIRIHDIIHLQIYTMEQPMQKTAEKLSVSRHCIISAMPHL